METKLDIETDVEETRATAAKRGLQTAGQPTYLDARGRIIYPTEYPHIVRVAELRRGRPVIEGTGFEVQHIIGYYYEVGMSVEEMAVEWDYLPIAAIFSALAYYHDHKEEIDRMRYENSDEYWKAQRVMERV